MKLVLALLFALLPFPGAAQTYPAKAVKIIVPANPGGGLDLIGRTVADQLGRALGQSFFIENSSGGGDLLGSRLEELARMLDGIGADRERLGFCLDTAHLWGAGYDVSTADGAIAVVDRFDELIGLDRLALVHLNDSRSEFGSRADRHEHVGAGRIGPAGLGALLRDDRLRGTTFIMETPGVDEGWDAVNMRRAWLLWNGASELPTLPPKAFQTNRRSTRMVRPGSAPGASG